MLDARFGSRASFQGSGLMVFGVLEIVNDSETNPWTYIDS